MREAVEYVHYTSRKLETSEKPRQIVEYYATGSGVFPFDMLRYDRAWPATESDSHLMFAGLYGEGAPRRTVKIWSYREPTPARWDSFTWKVDAMKPRQTEQ